MLPIEVASGIEPDGNPRGSKRYVWLAPWIKIGAIGGLPSVILVMLLGQPRIFWTMAQDGLLPAWCAQVHPRFKTPYITTIITGVGVAAMAGAFPIGVLGELVSIGTLLAFCLVCLGVLVLRYVRPEVPRPFRAPGMPVTAILGFAVCLVQMISLPLDTWLRLIIWMALGLAIYFLYSRHHSLVGKRYRAGTGAGFPPLGTPPSSGEDSSS